MSTVELYDTTLRDGAQQQGIALSVDDKVAITERLDSIGIDYIEGGYAGANPKEDEFFSKSLRLSLSHAVVTAFGNTRRPGSNVSGDATIDALLRTEAPVITLVGKASEMQVLEILETSLEENLSMIEESVTHLIERDRRVFFDAEHFFDGYISNSEYAIQAIRVAAQAGAECVVLCDTNGGLLPNEIARITRLVRSSVNVRLGIHTHNDTDTAVAGALAAFHEGAEQIQGTLNGYGERCGNANLVSIIGNLQLKLGIKAISDEQLADLTETSLLVSEIVNRRPFPFAPYVGANAFSHKGGLHAQGVQKVADSYQHVNPEMVGNHNAVVISELSGKSNVLRRVAELGMSDDVTKDDASRLVKLVKERENKGFAYEGAHASFELLVRRSLQHYDPPFELIYFMVVIQNRQNISGGDVGPYYSEATIKVRVGENRLHTAAEGNGPVNALDNALRKALLQFYPKLSAVRLTDYKVRVVSEGRTTGAGVRVTIESADDKEIWHTVGASSNIVEASWLALADSMEWWLTRQLKTTS